MSKKETTVYNLAGLKGVKAEAFLNCMLSGVDEKPMAVKVKEFYPREVRLSSGQRMSKDTAVSLELHCPKHKLRSNLQGMIVEAQNNPNAKRFYATVHFDESSSVAWLQWLQKLSDLEIQQTRKGAVEKLEEVRQWEQKKKWAKMLRALQQARGIDPTLQDLQPMEAKAKQMLWKQRVLQMKLAGLVAAILLVIAASATYHRKLRDAHYVQAMKEAQLAKEANDHHRAHKLVDVALTFRPGDSITIAWRKKELMPLEYAEMFKLPESSRDGFENPVQRGRDPKSGLPLELVHKNTGMHFMLVSAGSFLMGSPKEEENRGADEEQHRVNLNLPFYLGKYEINVGIFRAFIEQSGYQTEAEVDGGGYVHEKDNYYRRPDATWKSPGFPQEDVSPVVLVTVKDIQRFLKWLNGSQGEWFGLPTEAQWEYACRGGRDSPFSWGTNSLYSRHYANVGDLRLLNMLPKAEVFQGDDGQIFPMPVNRLVPNDFGFYNMIGNVWEWCSDWYDADYYATSPAFDPKGPPSGSRKAIRGGSWTAGPKMARCASRSSVETDYRNNELGFRVTVMAPGKQP